MRGVWDPLFCGPGNLLFREYRPLFSFPAEANRSRLSVSSLYNLPMLCGKPLYITHNQQGALQHERHSHEHLLFSILPTTSCQAMPSSCQVPSEITISKQFYLVTTWHYLAWPCQAATNFFNSYVRLESCLFPAATIKSCSISLLSLIVTVLVQTAFFIESSCFLGWALTVSRPKSLNFRRFSNVSWLNPRLK